MVLENDRDDEDIGRESDDHHWRIEADQQVIGLAMELVIDVPKYRGGAVQVVTLVRQRGRAIVRQVVAQRRHRLRVVARGDRHASSDEIKRRRTISIFRGAGVKAAGIDFRQRA